MHTAIALCKGGRPRTEFRLAVRRSSRALPPRARARVTEAGKPRRPGPDLLELRASGSRSPATRPPTPSRPAEGWN